MAVARYQLGWRMQGLAPVQSVGVGRGAAETKGGDTQAQQKHFILE